MTDISPTEEAPSIEWELKHLLDRYFKFKPGDRVEHLTALAFRGTDNADAPVSQNVGLIAERLLQQCEGGFQRQYLVRWGVTHHGEKGFTAMVPGFAKDFISVKEIELIPCRSALK